MESSARSGGISALVFDWGGVVQRSVDPGLRRALDDALGLPRGGTEAAVFDSPEWPLASTGQLDALSLWRKITERLGISPSELGDFVQRFFAGDALDAWLLSCFGFWRTQGYHVGLLSNAPPPLDGLFPTAMHGAVVPGRWGMPDTFDAQVLSHRLGVCKPDRRAYLAIARALHVTPDQCLFVDDMPANVTAALRAGMAGVLYAGNAKLRSDLASLGIVSPVHEPCQE